MGAEMTGGGGMIYCLDPGEVHCGFAWFQKHGSEWKCVLAGETRPFTVYNTLENDPMVMKVIIEEFRLYPWKMAEQGFSQIKTVEVIGAIKYICHRKAIEVVEQPASIKKPTEGILAVKGVLLRSRGHGPHAKDAELHGHYALNRQGEK